MADPIYAVLINKKKTTNLKHANILILICFILVDYSSKIKIKLKEKKFEFFSIVFRSFALNSRLLMCLR